MFAGFKTPHSYNFRIPADGWEMPDPLDPDAPADRPLIVTRRRLIRLALVAAETGARFQRDGLDHDPVAWMLTPREMFEGHDAIEGALSLNGCLRAILLHGLSMGLDADPAAIDELVSGDEAASTLIA